jgi:hypothetical protein
MEQRETQAQTSKQLFAGTQIEIPEFRKTRHLEKKLQIKIFETRNKKAQTIRLVPPKKTAYAAKESILRTLEYLAQQLTINLPDHRYKCIEVGRAQFNFVWESQKGKSNGEQATESANDSSDLARLGQVV